MSKLSIPEARGDRDSYRETLREGLRQLREGRADLAISLLAPLYAQTPGEIEMGRALAIAFMREGRPAEALELFDGIVNRSPGDAQAHHGRGLCRHGLGNRAGALDAFRQAVIADPLAWRAWQSMADITPFEDDRIHALEGAADALEVQTSGADVSPELLAAAVAAFIEARDPARARRLLEQRGAERSDIPLLIRALARSLYHQGNFEGAFREACRLMAQITPRSGGTPQKRFEPGRAVDVLSEIQGLLSASGVQSFLAAGTMLGFYRTGAPLPHDRDIDLGIIREPGQDIDIAGILRAHPDIFLPRISRPGDRYFGFVHKDVAVDLFLYDTRGDMLVCGFSALSGDIEWRFTRFGLERRRYGGADWTVPGNPERYLAESYGPSWRTPDRGFASVVSSPALYETDAYARSYYAVIRACRAAEAGNLAKARALLRQAPHSTAQPAGW